MSVTVRHAWSWTGATRRHDVRLSHNQLTGAQLLEVDGEVMHRTRFQYKLTGVLFFVCDGSTVEIYTRTADETGALSYALSVDSREVREGAARRVSTWVATVGGALHQIEFEHASFEVLVDGAKVEAVGDFVDEGSAYAFVIGRGEVPATITVLPALDRRSPLRTSLTVAGEPVAQSELLGAEAPERGAAAAGGSAARRPSGTPGR